MNRTFVIQIMLIVTILSACSGKAPVETVTPTLAETLTLTVPITGVTATESSLATEVPATTPTATVEFTATPTPTRPANAADCTNSAAFVTDVTIPDNTQIEGGAEFVKTWRVMNNGTCIWASDYKLVYYSEERMNAPDEVPLALTYPGQTLDISVTLTAPNSIGAHRSNFVLTNPEGLFMKIAG